MWIKLTMVSARMRLFLIDHSDVACRVRNRRVLFGGCFKIALCSPFLQDGVCDRVRHALLHVRCRPAARLSPQSESLFPTHPLYPRRPRAPHQEHQDLHAGPPQRQGVAAPPPLPQEHRRRRAAAHDLPYKIGDGKHRVHTRPLALVELREDHRRPCDLEELAERVGAQGAEDHRGDVQAAGADKRGLDGEEEKGGEEGCVPGRDPEGVERAREKGPEEDAGDAEEGEEADRETEKKNR
jgi:hypothetical protein